MRGNATELNQHGEGWVRPLSYYTGGVTKSTSLSPEHCDWTQPHKSPSSEVRIRCQVELLHQLLREAVNLPPGQNFERKITSKTFRPESHEKCRLMSMKVHWLQGVELHWSSSSTNAGQNITSTGLGNKMVSSYFSIHKHIKPKPKIYFARPFYLQRFGVLHFFKWEGFDSSFNMVEVIERGQRYYCKLPKDANIK